MYSLVITFDPINRTVTVVVSILGADSTQEFSGSNLRERAKMFIIEELLAANIDIRQELNNIDARLNDAFRMYPVTDLDTVKRVLAKVTPSNTTYRILDNAQGIQIIFTTQYNNFATYAEFRFTGAGVIEGFNTWADR